MRSQEIDEGPVIIILLSCLSVALCFLSFGLGLLNLAGAKERAVRVSAPTAAPVAAPSALTAGSAPLRSRLGNDSEPRASASGRTESRGQRPRPKPSALEPVRAPVDTSAVESHIQRLRAQLEDTKKELERRQRELQDLLDRLAWLQSQAAGLQTAVEAGNREIGVKEAARAKAEHDMAELRTRIEAARKRIDELDRKIQEERQKAKDAERVRLRFSGVGLCKKPQWVECLQDAVMLQPQQQRLTLEQLRAKSSLAAKALSGECIAFGVRPQGFDSFLAARALAEANNIPVAYAPFEEREPLPISDEVLRRKP